MKRVARWLISISRTNSFATLKSARGISRRTSVSANLLSPTALLAGRPDFTSTWILLRVCYLALVLLSCFAGIHPLWAATHLQQASLSDVTSKTYTSVSVTFPVATTAGNAIILGLSFGNINPVITATDSQGNTYFQAIKTYD